MKTKPVSPEDNPVYDDLLLLMNSIEDYAVIRLDTEGVITSWNKGAEKIKGYTSEEAIGNLLSIFYTAEDIENGLPKTNLNQAAINGTYTATGYRVKKDGSLFWADMVITALYTNERKLRGFVKITRDLTIQKNQSDEIERLHVELEKTITERLNQALKENNDYKYALDESAIIAITDQTGTIIHVNQNFCKISKYNKFELIGQDHRIINSGYHDRDFIRGLWTTIANGNVWRGELKNRAKDGGFYWVDTTIVPFLNEKGKPYQYLAIRSDITERKTSEHQLMELNSSLQKYTQELSISNSELEQYAYIASHDLQEPLRAVTCFLNLLERKYGDQVGNDGRQYIQFAINGAKRMRKVILDLLEFSRTGRYEKKEECVDLNQVVTDITSLYKDQIDEKRARVSWSKLPIIITHKTPVQQVLQNFIENSLKYQKAGGVPVVEISGEEMEDYWKISVKDNGIGIKPAYFEKIFILFQRLHHKDEYAGTGIGLAIAKKVVQNLGGTIGVNSEPGVGSTFYFTISKTQKK